MNYPHHTTALAALPKFNHSNRLQVIDVPGNLAIVTPQNPGQLDAGRERLRLASIPRGKRK
jgi:hypothetical protein